VITRIYFRKFGFQDAKPEYPEILKGVGRKSPNDEGPAHYSIRRHVFSFCGTTRSTQPPAVHTPQTELRVARKRLDNHLLFPQSGDDGQLCGASERTATSASSYLERDAEAIFHEM
jgi:hypothetical protein